MFWDLLSVTCLCQVGGYYAGSFIKVIRVLVITLFPLTIDEIVYPKGVDSWDLGTQIMFAILIPQAFGATI